MKSFGTAEPSTQLMSDFPYALLNGRLCFSMRTFAPQAGCATPLKKEKFYLPNRKKSISGCSKDTFHNLIFNFHFNSYIPKIPPGSISLHLTSNNLFYSV